jgi:hypothetical protein
MNIQRKGKNSTENGPDKRTTPVNCFVYAFYVLFLASLITLCDYYCHLRLGVLSYNFPEHGISLFPNHPTSDVFLGFVGMSLFCAVSGKVYFGSMPAPSIVSSAASIIIFASQYYASGVFQDFPMTINNVFLVTWGVRLVKFDSRFVNTLLLYSLVLGIGGPLVEGFYSSAVGFFVYNSPHAYNVPMWLCPLYLNGALAVASTVASIESWLNPDLVRNKPGARKL